MSAGSEPDIEVVIADDAIERLASYAAAKRWGGVLLVMDGERLDA